MAKLDALKDKADTLRLWLKVALNTLFAIFVGIGTLIFQFSLKNISSSLFYKFGLLLLIIGFIVAIIILIITDSQIRVRKELEKEKD